MSVAEKLTQIAENTPLVYESGYNEGYEKGKAEGGGGLTPSEGLEFVETYDRDGYAMEVNTYGWIGLGTCTDTEIVVPCANPANGRPIVSVGAINDKFEGLGNIWLESAEKVYLPDTICCIEDLGFMGGGKVKYIKFGRYLNFVGEYQFSFPFDVPTDLVLDFSDFALTNPPTLEDVSIFQGVVEVRVPSAMVSKFKTATNWASVADKIVGV